MESGANDPRLPQDLRLIRRLGESPLSLVFLVEDTGGLRYALKVLRPSVARDQRILERWRREAKLLEEFDHPNLVHCYGSPEVEGRPALLLEFIDGSTLREKLRAGPLGWEQAARFGVQIARALHYMHRHGAIHRDVKPHNVLIDLERGAILADLGLVRREEDPTMTRQGAALGSPAYMSPEQARDPSEVDEQADIYSLGATLFHCLSGKPPFLGKGVGEVIHRVLHEDPEDLPHSVPPTLAKVVLTAMAKNPERRYARVRDFGSDLGRVLLGYPPRLLTRYRRRRQLRTLTLAAVGLLAVGMFWWHPWTPDSDHDPPQDVATTEAPTTGPSLAASDPTTSSPPASTPELRAEPFFSAWHSPYQRRFQTSLANGQFREALAECSAIQRALVPADAPLGFLDLRRDWILDAESQVTAVAERTAGQALDLLTDQVAFARDSIERGNFDGEAWFGRVLDLWRRAGLRVADLPLHPGSPDPVGRLLMTQVVLENEAEQVRIRLALGMVAAVRKNTAQLLRAGSFAEARRRWDRVDPVVFLHSSEARADLARIEELLALDRRLQTRFRELSGQHVELLLRSGGTLQGRLVTNSSGTGHAVDYLGQARVEVDLLDLDVAFSVSWLLGREQAWLQAQLSWCQDNLRAAISTMRPLATPDLPTEWRPEFWVDQWQQERASGVISDLGISGDGQFLSAVDPLSPQQQLVAELRARLPDARVRQLGDAVELDLGSLDLRQSWNLDLRQELRSWRVVAWHLRWQLGLDQKAPSRLTWLGDIVLTRNGSAPAQMSVGGRRLSGYGIVPGLGIQILSWDGEQLQLDGIPLGPWQPPTARLTRFVVDCPDGFLFDSVRLRFAPR